MELTINRNRKPTVAYKNKKANLAYISLISDNCEYAFATR